MRTLCFPWNLFLNKAWSGDPDHALLKKRDLSATQSHKCTCNVRQKGKRQLWFKPTTKKTHDWVKACMRLVSQEARCLGSSYEMTHKSCTIMCTCKTWGTHSQALPGTIQGCFSPELWGWTRRCGPRRTSCCPRCRETLGRGPVLKTQTHTHTHTHTHTQS